MRACGCARAHVHARVCVCEWWGGGRARKLQQTTALAERSRARPPAPPAGAASAEAIHDFSDVIPGVGGRAWPPGAEPRPRPYKYRFPGSLWGRELVCAADIAGSGAVSRRRTANAQCRRPAAWRPLCAPDILTQDAVTVFKSQGRGSGYPRTSCLFISPFTGEYLLHSLRASVSRPWLLGPGASARTGWVGRAAGGSAGTGH